MFYKDKYEYKVTAKEGVQITEFVYESKSASVERVYKLDNRTPEQIKEDEEKEREENDNENNESLGGTDSQEGGTSASGSDILKYLDLNN